jgi:hypothetical protein
MTTPNPSPPAKFQIEVPDDEVVGRYSNFLSVWSGPHDFTLDFAVTAQAKPPEAEGDPIVVPTRVVARIKIPLAFAQDVLQAIASQISVFEASAGQPVPRLQDKRPMYPPEDQ